MSINKRFSVTEVNFLTVSYKLLESVNMSVLTSRSSTIDLSCDRAGTKSKQRVKAYTSAPKIVFAMPWDF